MTLQLKARLIPAHAGKTLAGYGGLDQQRAHPRSRGENSVAEQHLDERLGSSPLTRGKLGVVGVRGPVVGLIPAHAGKTPRG